MASTLFSQHTYTCLLFQYFFPHFPGDVCLCVHLQAWHFCSFSWFSYTRRITGSLCIVISTYSYHVVTTTSNNKPKGLSWWTPNTKSNNSNVFVCDTMIQMALFSWSVTKKDPAGYDGAWYICTCVFEAECCDGIVRKESWCHSVIMTRRYMRSEIPLLQEVTSQQTTQLNGAK